MSCKASKTGAFSQIDRYEQISIPPPLLLPTETLPSHYLSPVACLRSSLHLYAAWPAFFRGHLICAFALLCRHTLPTSQVLHGARRCVILFKEGNTSLKTSLGLGCIPVLTRRHIESAPPGPGPRARTEIMHYCTKICLTEPTQTIEKKVLHYYHTDTFQPHLSVHVSPLCCIHRASHV